MAYRSLCIFLESGRTYTFRNVQLVQDNETALVFLYTATSDGNDKKGTFFKTHVVGFSTME